MMLVLEMIVYVCHLLMVDSKYLGVLCSQVLG